MYLLSMILPYIPGCISFIYLQKWTNNTHKKFINLLKKSQNLNPLTFRDNALKEKINSLASRNSFNIISSSLSFFHDFSTLFLNSFFSLITISTLLPRSLATGYIISSLLSFLLIFLTKNIIEKYHIKTENSFIKYSNSLSKLSENMSLKNNYNEIYFNSESFNNGNNYYKTVLKTQKIKQFLNIFLAFIAMIPTCYLIYSYLSLQINSASTIAAIIVNLTRIFTILSSLNSLLNYIIEIPGIIGQNKVLFSFLNTYQLSIGEVHGFHINGKYYTSEEEMKSLLLNAKFGRFTITGENGSGKSTLLHNLKNTLNYEAILIPTNINELSWGSELNSLSTGQKIKHILENTFKGKERFIILDEWDANLDKKNKNDLNIMIGNISKDKVVIEVTHQKF